MAKILVIVESPAKAKTINKYLGKDYVVKSSVGHIRDLPTAGSAAKVDPAARAKAAALARKLPQHEREALKKANTQKALIARMGIDPENAWTAHYEILPGKEKIVSDLRRDARKAQAIYLATDLDREGEAIAWHVMKAIGGDESRYRRVVFNEITKKAIRAAFDAPSDLNYNRVDAQQARRFLDRVVGYTVSPLLWSKIARGLSAGRVQSVAVRLIVEREKLIRAFVPEEYWDILAQLQTPQKEGIRCEVKKYQGKAFLPTNKTDCDAALKLLRPSTFHVVKRDDKPTKLRPHAPLITSTLQQAASTRLGFSVKKTMMLAQRLYEAGHITYMRTDSTNLSNDAVEACRVLIKSNYGQRYLPEKALRYSSKSGAQEAHEAIRPSQVNTLPPSMGGAITGIDGDGNKLYHLIWQQFVACQMTSAEFDNTTLTIKAEAFELKSKGRVQRFDGFTKVMPALSRKEDLPQLPDVQSGDVLQLEKIQGTQHFTKPSPRFTEASLVRELEKQGIGRPSTYASIISTIQDRGYVSLEHRRFFAQKMGDIVTDRLVESFSNLMDFGFTARMEQQLDGIAEGSLKWKQVLDEFYDEFKQTLSKAESAEDGMRHNTPVETSVKCPDCQRYMAIRNAASGVFLGCLGYNLPVKERCKKTLNLASGNDVVNVVSEDEEFRLLRDKRRCTLCNSAMESYLLDSKHKMHICGNNPDCLGYQVEEGEFKIKGYEGPIIQCDKCDEDMQLKSGRFGKYFGCTSETCKNTRKLLKSGEPAPPKADPIPMPELKCQKADDHYVLRDGAAGIFLAASRFPKIRETRAPLVSELLVHKQKLDPKFHYLVEAPVADPDGNPSIIRFSRKTKEQYVTSEIDKKATGWTAFFKNGAWNAQQSKSKKKRAS